MRVHALRVVARCSGLRSTVPLAVAGHGRRASLRGRTDLERCAMAGGIAWCARAALVAADVLASCADALQILLAVPAVDAWVPRVADAVERSDPICTSAWPTHVCAAWRLVVSHDGRATFIVAYNLQAVPRRLCIWNRSAAEGYVRFANSCVADAHCTGSVLPGAVHWRVALATRRRAAASSRNEIGGETVSRQQNERRKGESSDDRRGFEHVHACSFGLITRRSQWLRRLCRGQLARIL